MKVGDQVVYKGQVAKIVEIKWGLCCIKFLHTGRQIWVDTKVLTWN